MKTGFFFLLCTTLLLSGCSGSSEEQTAVIQGDWVSEPFTTIRKDKHRLLFSFEGAKSTLVNPYAPLLGFKIRNGILFTVKPEEEREKGAKGYYAFRIVRLEQHTLSLVPLDSTLKKSIAYQFPGLKSDTIVLTKIRPQNKLVPTNISFYSSMCYGTCPSMSLEIGKTGSVSYFGSYYAEKLGGHTGQLNKTDYRKLVAAIHTLPLKTMKESYTAGWSDQQTCCIVLQSKKEGKQQCYVYGYGEEPIELRLLFRRLFAVPHQAHLKPDTAITETGFAAFHFYLQFTRENS